MPDGRLPDLNDGHWAAVAPLLARAAELYPERADFCWAATRGREGAPPAEASLTFPYAGYYVMRSGWEPDAVWALFDGGPFGFAHQHEDKLNLLLHAYGRLLLTEGGNYAYDDSAMRRYVLSTRAHNTVRADGRDQNRRLHFRPEDVDIAAPAGARWRTSDRYDAVEAGYDEGYGPEADPGATSERLRRGEIRFIDEVPGPAADRAVTHRRRVIFLKRGVGDLGPCFLVIDRLIPADGAPHTYEALWHFDVEAAEAAGLAARGGGPGDRGGPGLTLLAAGPPGLRLAIVAGREEPEWQGWKAVKNNQQGEYAPAPTAVYTWTGAGPARLVTLLYPTRPGETCPVGALSAAAAIGATALSLSLAEGRALDLDEADFPLDEPAAG